MFEFVLQPLMTLSSMIMQASTGNESLDAIVGIVLAIAAIAGVVGSLMKQINKDSKIAGMLDTFSQKTVENEEMMYRIGSAVRTAVPEIEDPLKKYGADLGTLKNRVTVGAEQLEILRALVLKEKEKAKHLELPREAEPVFHS